MTDRKYYKRRNNNRRNYYATNHKIKKRRNSKTAGVILLLILVIIIAFILLRTKFSNENTKTSSKAQTEANNEALEKGYNLPIDDKESEQAEKECKNIAKAVQEELKKNGTSVHALISDINAGKKESSSEFEKVILAKMDEKEYPVRGFGIYENLHNYKKVDEFIDKAKKEKKCEVVLYEIHEDGGFVRENFKYDGKDMYLLYTNVNWSNTDDPEPQITSSEYSRVKKWKYTDKGWLCYELCVPEPPEVTEVINGNAMIRVLPLDEKNKEFAQKYLVSIGYQGNNLLCSEWDENNMSKLDYCGLYEYFYAMQTGSSMDQEKYLDGIPKEEFVSVLTRYLPVTEEQLKEYALYDSAREVFAWGRLGCMTYSPNPFGTSVPEVTKMTENADGTIRVTVDAICEWYGDNQIFSHELTVRIQEDGNIEYLANHVLEPGLENIPNYQYRLDGIVQ